MPDTEAASSCAPADAPANWHDAFAALPAQTPTPDGWRRLRRACPPQRRHVRALALGRVRDGGLAIAGGIAAMAPACAACGDPGVATGAHRRSPGPPTP